MFVKAIEEIQQFTRPLHTIFRHYHNDFIQGGAATLFFVNEEGIALTCRHVLEGLLNEHNINATYSQFKTERNALGPNTAPGYSERLQALEARYNYNTPAALAQMKSNFINCTDSTSYDYVLHPVLDLAIIKFKAATRHFYTSYATFLKDGSTIKQGQYLCRFGFPFAEFTNYAYDSYEDEIGFTAAGNMNSPSFPIDGMVTRHVVEGGKMAGVELSTPGLRGQSGGPLFDSEGIIYGMQSQTAQYHMGFDEQNIEIISQGRRTTTVNHSFLNVGRCVHVDAIKEFLSMAGVRYYEQ